MQITIHKTLTAFKADMSIKVEKLADRVADDVET
jgi:hypothetical protein